MNQLHRRAFIASAATAASASPLFAAFEEPLNVQLYTVRNELAKDPQSTLAAIKRIGFAYVEPSRPQMLKIEPICKDLGLKTPAGHFEAPLVTGNFEPWKAALGNTVPPGYDWQKAVEQARGWGMTYMVISYLMKSERDAPGFYEKFCDQMNKAGETARKAGVTLCFHHHSFEFEPVGGKRAIDTMIARFDPSLVKFQIDTFWVKAGGDDPGTLIGKLKGRVALVHLKDIQSASFREYQEGKVPPNMFRECGSGVLDFSGILKACKQAGVAGYIVEQDHCPASPIESLAKSYKYLRSL